MVSRLRRINTLVDALQLVGRWVGVVEPWIFMERGSEMLGHYTLGSKGLHITCLGISQLHLAYSTEIQV